LLCRMAEDLGGDGQVEGDDLGKGERRHVMHRESLAGILRKRASLPLVSGSPYVDAWAT
jgi:hypothetical protein